MQFLHTIIDKIDSNNQLNNDQFNSNIAEYEKISALIMLNRCLYLKYELYKARLQAIKCTICPPHYQACD